MSVITSLIKVVHIYKRMKSEFETEVNSQSTEKEKLERILAMSYRRVLSEQCTEDMNDEEKIALVCKNALEKSVDVVGLDNQEFTGLVNDLRENFDGSATAFVTLLAESVTTYFLQTYSLTEIGQLMRKNTLERLGLVGIGEFLSYEFTDSDTIALHATPLFLDDPREFIKIWSSDFRILVEELEQSEALASVKVITVASHIVTKMQSSLTRLGFYDFNGDPKTGVTTARVEKDILITQGKKVLNS